MRRRRALEEESARLLRSIRAWRGSTVATKVDTHEIRARADQRSAPTKAECRSDRPQETVEGGVGPVAGA